MARFRFRLEAVLRVRRLALQEAQRVVAARMGQIQECRRRETVLEGQIEAHLSAARSTLCGATLAIEQAVWDRYQLTRLRQGLGETQDQIARHQTLLARERHALAEAHKAVRTLERLEEKQREAFDAQQRRLERIEDDERNVLRAAHGLTG